MVALGTTAFSFTLLPDTPKLQLLVAGLCLAGALLLGAVIIALVNRWRRRHSSEDELSPSAQLAQFRSLYEAGTINKEEFERLRNLLGTQMRQTLGVPSPAPLAPPTPAKLPQGENGQPPDKPESDIRPA